MKMVGRKFTLLRIRNNLTLFEIDEAGNLKKGTCEFRWVPEDVPAVRKTDGYLARDERIISLAKEKYEKYLRKEPLEDVWDLKFRSTTDLPPSSKDILSDLRKIGDAIFRPLLRKIEEREYMANPLFYTDPEPYYSSTFPHVGYREDLPLHHNIRLLRKEYAVTTDATDNSDVIAEINQRIEGSGVTIRDITDESGAVPPRPYFRCSDPDFTLRIQYEVEGIPGSMCAYGLRNANHKKSRANCLFRNGRRGVDLGLFLAFLFVMKIANERYAEIRENSNPDTDQVYVYSKQWFNDRNSLYSKGEWIPIPYESDLFTETVLRKMADLCTDLSTDLSDISRWIIPEDVFYADKVETLLKKLGINAERVASKHKEISARIREVEKANSNVPKTAVISRRAWNHVLSCYGLLGALRGYIPFPSLEEMVEISCDERWLDTHNNVAPLPHVSFFDDEFLKFYFRAFLLIKKEKCAYVRAVKEARKSYKSSLDRATPYMTKKNIPQKTLDAMDKSDFNKWFSNVEFDEATDLEKAVDVAREFAAVYEDCFPFVDSTKNEIRFRALGNYRAAGMYWPFFMCLCVDYRHLSSFIHEYGHLIDYTYGRLSDQAAFSYVRDLYEKSLRKEMETNEKFKKEMMGSTKYNLTYFLTPTEIFARSLELYISYEKGVKNSLLETQEMYEAQPEYPTGDSNYMDAVRVYFDALFNDLSEKKDKKETA